MIICSCIKVFISGCRIWSRYCNISVFWNGSITHKILDGFSKVKWHKAITGSLTMVMCGLAFYINPVVVKADLGKNEVERTAEERKSDLDKIEGIQKSETKVEQIQPQPEPKTETKKEEQEVSQQKKVTIEKEKEDKSTKEVVEEPKKQSAWQEIPLCETESPVKTYMDDVKITARYSEQWKLFNEAKFGEVITDEIGFQYVLGNNPDTDEDMKYYTVALGTYYMDYVGQKFRITMENGFQFGAIVGDIKSDAHTHAGNKSSDVPKREGHNSNACVAGSNDMIEFIIDAQTMMEFYPGRNGLANNGTMNYNFDEEHMFEGKITKIEVLAEE